MKEMPERKERREQNVHYHFAFAPHGHWGEMRNVAERIKDADVVVPELVGWTTADQQILQGVSDGTYTLKKADALFGDLARVDHRDLTPQDWEKFRELAKLVAGSKKLIFYADLPAGDVTETHANIPHQMDESARLFRSGRLAEAIASARTSFETFAAGEQKRERHIIDSLTRSLPAAIQKSGRFQQKTDIQVLVSLGSGHSHLSQLVKKKGADVSRSFPGSSTLFTIGNEVLRRMERGKAVTDELLAQCFMESLLASRIGIPDRPHGVSSILAGLMARRIPLETIRSFTDQLAQMPKPPGDVPFQRLFGAFLDTHGIAPLRTPEDVLAFIKNRFGADSSLTKELAQLISKNVSQATWGERLLWWAEKHLPMT